MLQITPPRLELESPKGVAVTATIVITNRVTSPVIITSIVLAGETGFYTITPPTLPLTLAPGASVGVPIVYDPSDAVLEKFVTNATLVVVSDTGLIASSEILGSVVNEIAATAAATAAATPTTPESIAAAVDAGITGDGSVVPDQLIINSIQGAPATGVIAFTNVTATPFTIVSLVLTGDQTLTIPAPPSLPLTVPANGSVSLTVRYDPSDLLGLPNFLARAVLVALTSQGKLIRSAVIGRILNPESDTKSVAGTEINPPLLDLKSIQGVLTTGRFSITNTSSTSLVINKIDLVGDIGQIALVSSLTLPLTIPANDSLVLTISYSPPNVSGLPIYESKAQLSILTNSGRVIRADIKGSLLTPQKLATGETLPGGSATSVVLPAASPTEPANPKTGDYWLDSSVTPNRVWRYDGFVWTGQTMTGINANKFCGDKSINIVKSLAGTITGTLLGNPSTGLTFGQGSVGTGGGFTVGTVVQYGYTYVSANGESLISPIGSYTVVTGTAPISVSINGISVGPAGTTARKLYRIIGGVTYLATTIANNTTTTFADPNPTSGTIASPPVSFATGNYKYVLTATDSSGIEKVIAGPSTIALSNSAVHIVNIAIGPVGTISRRLYRTNVNENSFFQIGVIADNTTTTFNDLPSLSPSGFLSIGNGWIELGSIANAAAIDGIKILTLDCDLLINTGGGFYAIGIANTGLTEGILEELTDIPAASVLSLLAKTWDNLYFFSTQNYPKLALGVFSTDPKEISGSATWVYAHIKRPLLSLESIP